MARKKAEPKKEEPATRAVFGEEEDENRVPYACRCPYAPFPHLVGEQNWKAHAKNRWRLDPQYEDKAKKAG